MLRRFGALTAVAALVLVFTPALAIAAPPDHLTIEQTVDYVTTDVCSFAVDVSASQVAVETDRYDGAGNFVGLEATIREVDTFSANGQTLVSDPFSYHVTYRLDKNGELTGYAYAGVLLRITLPDDQLLLSGRTSFPDPSLTFISPDHGTAPDLAAFCAALGA